MNGKSDDPKAGTKIVSERQLRAAASRSPCVRRHWPACLRARRRACASTSTSTSTTARSSSSTPASSGSKASCRSAATPPIARLGAVTLEAYNLCRPTVAHDLLGTRFHRHGRGFIGTRGVSSCMAPAIHSRAICRRRSRSAGVSADWARRTQSRAKSTHS